MKMSNTLVDLRCPISRTTTQYLIDRKIQAIQLPTVERKRLEISRRGDVFSKTFKESLLSTSPDFRVSAFLGTSSSRTLTEQKKSNEMSSMISQANRTEKRFLALKNKAAEVFSRKAELVEAKHDLQMKISNKILDFDNKEVWILKNTANIFETDCEKDNEELRKEVRRLALEVQSLRDRVEKVQNKVSLLEDFANGR